MAIDAPAGKKRLRTALTRTLQVVLLTALVAGSLGAANSAARYDKLGHQMMCTCGCAEILVECNHVGCPNSTGMLATLRHAIARGDSNDAILHLFEAKYGPTALAAPMLTRFNAIAWIVPPALLLLGIAGAIGLIRRWRAHHALVPLPLRPHSSSKLHAHASGRRQSFDRPRLYPAHPCARPLHLLPRETGRSQSEKTRLEYLRERKEALYDNLRDLNFEYRAGKYREEEYATERGALENEAAEVVGELDLLEGVPGASPS